MLLGNLALIGWPHMHECLTSGRSFFGARGNYNYSVTQLAPCQGKGNEARIVSLYYFREMPKEHKRWLKLRNLACGT